MSEEELTGTTFKSVGWISLCRQLQPVPASNQRVDLIPAHPVGIESSKDRGLYSGLGDILGTCGRLRACPCRQSAWRNLRVTSKGNPVYVFVTWAPEKHARTWQTHHFMAATCLFLRLRRRVLIGDAQRRRVRLLYVRARVRTPLCTYRHRWSRGAGSVGPSRRRTPCSIRTELVTVLRLWGTLDKNQALGAWRRCPKQRRGTPHFAGTPFPE